MPIWDGYKITYNLKAIRQRIKDIGLTETTKMLNEVFSEQITNEILEAVEEYAH